MPRRQTITLPNPRVRRDVRRRRRLRVAPDRTVVIPDRTLNSLLCDRRLRRALRKGVKEVEPRGPSMRYIRGLVEWVALARAAARMKTTRRLSTGMALTLLGAIALGLQGFALAGPTSDRRPTIFPTDWIRANGGPPRPELVLHALLVQVANHALAVLYLVEAGLGGAANAALRILHEVAWLLLAVAADRSKMQVYVEAVDEKTARKIWAKHFHSRELNATLVKVERALHIHRTTLWTCPGFIDTWVKWPVLRIPAAARTLGD